MADYYINSDKGKELANSLKAGDMAEASDGSLWRKESDGSISVIKNGQTMTGRVGVSAPDVSESPSFGASPTVETPTLDAATGTARTDSPTYSLQQKSTESTSFSPEQTQQVLASEKARQATQNVTAGLGQSSDGDELLNQAIQQASIPDYKIGSAKGVLMTDNMQNAGDMAEAADGSVWKRNEDGSITVTKDGKTYKANIDREAAKRDPQWAALTALPESTAADSGTKSSKKSATASSGISDTYSASAPQTTQQNTAQATTATTDRAALRKHAATAQKEMGDLARQISVAKIRGKDTSELQAQYDAAKAQYDAATMQINAPQQLTTSAARQEQFDQRQTLIEEATRKSQVRQDLSTEAARDEKLNATNPNRGAQEQTTRGGFGGSRASVPGKVTEQEFNRSSAMQQQYGTYDNYLRGVYAGYDEARAAGTARRAADALASGKVSEAEFNRSTTMVERYGTYRNYLNGVRRSDSEIGQERAQRRIESLGVADLLGQYYNSEGAEQQNLRRQLAAKGVTGTELNEWRNTVFNDAGRFIGDAATNLFQGGMQQWQSGVEGALAGAETTANSVASAALRELAKALPDGSLKNGLSRISSELGSAESNHLRDARLLQEQLGQTMQDTTQDHSGVSKWIIEQMPSMGNMLLNSASAGALGVPSLGTLGTTAGGSAYVDARNDGANNGQALAYGIVNGALEVGSEKLFGGNPLYDTDAGLVNKLVSKLTDNRTVMRILNSKGFDLLSEGLEEVFTEITEPWAQALIYSGKDADFATLESVANAFAGGVFMSAVGNLTALPGQLESREAQAEINTAGQSVFRQALQTGDTNVQNAVRDVQSKIATGAQLTVEDIGHVLDVMAESNYEASPAQTAQDVARSTNRSAQQTTQPAQERGAESVITSNAASENISANDMGAMRSQFESVPKQAQTQSNTINSMETGWDVPEEQRTPIMYDTISETKSLDNARLRLAQDYAGEMAELRGKRNWSGEEVDMGMTILDNYRRAAEQTGDWTEYSNWRKEVSAHGTAAGQALQAYAKYSRQTGGGIVADASAALERAAKKTNKAEIMNRVNTLAQQYDAAIGTGQENASVNVNDLVDIIKSASTARQTGTLIGNKAPPIVNWAMNRIANYAKAEAQSGGGSNLDFLRTFAADSIYNIAADTQNVSTGEKIKTVRRMGMLSKVSTVMRNLVSNNVFDPIDSVARNISVPLDMLVSKITGTRSVAGDASWFSAAKRKGSMDGLARACMEVGLDVDASGGMGKYENTSNRTFKMSGGVFSKLMSVWEAYEGYTLNATDEFQKGGIEASVQQGIDRLYEQGKISDDSLRDAGKQEALYRTFQDKTVLSDAAIGIRNALNKAHIGDIGAGDIILPFAQVPSNLGARAIEYSPAGLGVAAADFINLIDAAQKGNFTAAQQAKAVQGVGRALTGSGMIAIAAAGALRGWLKVTGDDEDKNKDALGKTHGLDGTQLNISAALRDMRGESAEWRAGDQLLSIGFLDPLNAQLTTGALIADDIRSENVTAGRVFGNSLSGALQSVLDTPVMSTFQDIATNYEYSTASTDAGKAGDALKKYATNQLSSVIPNSLRGIAQGLDDTERNAYSSDNVWQQALDNAKASIPGLRETLPAKTDVWGNPVKNEGGLRNFMNRNINPGNITTYKTDEVSSEIEKISDATNTSLYPDRTAPRSLKVNGESVSLTFEQRSMYQKAYGDAYSSAVSALMNDKNYASMPDGMKAEILRQAKGIATEQARDSLGIGYDMKDSAKNILNASGKDRNNALISAAVKAQHYLSPETRDKLTKVEQQFGGADYIGLSDALFNSAKEQADAYFSAAEAAKYGGELSQTQKELSGKSSKELARYFMDEAIESRYSDANKSGTKADEYLKAYRQGELNDAMALAVLSDKEVAAYDRFGRSAKVTPEMALQAANAHAGMKDVKDEDGKVTSSAQDQFDAWLDKQGWTDDQKSAVRMGFYTDNVKTYSYLAEQLRKGNIKTADAKSELTTSYQAGWTYNVKDTGAKMADYIDAIVEYEERPSEAARKAAGYKNAWAWFCDYLNSTDLTQEQKYAIAISMYDYGDSTKKKIWDRLR